MDVNGISISVTQYYLDIPVFIVYISESADNASAANSTAETTSSSQAQDTAQTSHNLPTVTQPPFIRSQSHLAPFTLSQVGPHSDLTVCTRTVSHDALVWSSKPDLKLSLL